MNTLVDRVGEAIGARGLFYAGQSILIAVSGGLDSMVLLAVLHELSVRFNWRLVVAHYNHQLRGADSDADEEWVGATARKLGLEFAAGRADVKQFQRQGVSLEMAARKLRHDFLAGAARRFHCPAIALAHHVDDQVELFFLRLLRGAGGLGLAGMKWTGPSPSDPAIRLVRPLLAQPKSALLAFAQDSHLRFREDATNALLEPPRNRVRQELLPLLREKYQPALAHTVGRAMEILGAESEFAEAAARQWLAKSPRPDFAQLPLAVQRQGLLLQLFPMGVTPNFDLIEQLRCAPDKPVMIAPGLTLSRDRAGEIHPRRVGTLDFDVVEIGLDLSAECGTLRIGSLEIKWHISSMASEPSRAAKDLGVASPVKSSQAAAPAGWELFDADKVGGIIALRHWRPGDRFQPIGMPGPVKLQDLLTNQKVPPAQRRQLIVAVSGGGEIFWVEGLRISENFKLDNRTSRRLKWEWRAQAPRNSIAGAERTC